MEYGEDIMTQLEKILKEGFDVAGFAVGDMPVYHKELGENFVFIIYDPREDVIVQKYSIPKTNNGS